jgi:hypothetical protein
MASFTKSGTPSAFGKNNYKRSTVGMKFNSYTAAAGAQPLAVVVDGSRQKILQPGTCMAKITSGPDTGKVGPFQAVGTADRWTMTPGGTWSAGTYTVTVGSITTAPIPYNAILSVLQSALDAAFGAGSIVAGGGPQNTTATTYTSGGNYSGPQTVTLNIASVTGTSPTNAPVHTTTGVAGSLDGRSVTTNIVGLNETFLPWQLLEHDTEIAVLYDGTVYQAWCIEYDLNGLPIVLQNATATAMVAQKAMSITFM